MSLIWTGIEKAVDRRAGGEYNHPQREESAMEQSENVVETGEGVAVAPGNGPVLIDRAALDLVKFCSPPDEPWQYATMGLHITTTATEATNGHIAVRLPH